MSGEATFSFQLITFAMILRRKKTKRIAYVFSLMYYFTVSFLRVILGKHFLSDVLFAASLMMLLDGLLYIALYDSDERPRMKSIIK